MPTSTAVLGADLIGTTRQLLAYWLGKVGDRGMPRKSEIDPTEIPALLPYLLVFERRAPDSFSVRLAGTAVVQRLGFDPTGHPVLDVIAPAARAPIRRALNRILDEPCGLLAHVRDRYASGREVIVEVLRLPLSSEAGEPRFILCSTIETTDPTVWRGPQDRPALLAELVEQAFFTWSPGPDGLPVLSSTGLRTV
ncbi:PAS domain-containing protein [Tistlia consotensis]|uniref:PAS domain-containing protein n=1 Tax=Tistlia consotensis USBA 355 TaxID=560819 RepID=A0A1Y6C211_9PROT|nr:PAS domain-containing protein [Tistlia consotensis]SMF32590.1 PAS domain-containing protein [Tistlia consotensis USBA 355]SNR68656.1 PAS domain-containing protein [Tistlia consotensis]